MRRLFLVVIVMLSMLAIALPAPARAARTETFHFSFKGQFAEAFFSQIDPTGCIETFAGVFAVDGRVKTGPGKPDTESVAGIFISQYNFCTDELLVAADGFTPLDAGAFQIDRQLNSATLNTTIDVYDFVSNDTYQVDVNLEWTGVGAAFRVKDRFQIKTEGFKLNSRFDGTFRETEVSGSVETPWGTFTSEDVVFADMGSVKVGEVALIKQ